MRKLRIGTAGIPHAAKKRTSQDGVKCLAELGLGVMELEFVRSVQMKEKTAAEVAQVAAAESIHLTVHAPYYVNLNARDKDKLQASKERVLKAARIGAAAGAKSVTFHAGFYHDDEPDQVYRAVLLGTKEIRETLNDEGIAIELRPETTGAVSQFGSLEELIALSLEIPGVYPCVDFSHLHARSNGQFNTYEEFSRTLDLLKTRLGSEALQSLHMHVSGIDYGPKGEKKHLELRDSDMAYTELMQALIDFGVGGWLICESPVLEKDAIVLQETYDRLVAKTR